ncbi:MAG: ABC transporter permease, partial [Erysipelotrichaceae bacterium]|nr:ABC transporter permease [Erysipelotrichaceae bacterium]
MKKTNMIIKDTFREIKKTKGRFFSIFAIVMIGVSFFAGIMSSGPTMRKSADHYFDEYNLMDYRILSNFGLTTDDINAIRNIDGVESVSPGYEKDVLVTVNNKETVLRVHSLDMTHSQNNDNNYINQAIVLEGRLPNKHGECIVEQSKISENGINIGDSLVFKSGKDDE